jgi:hypothetical protein
MLDLAAVFGGKIGADLWLTQNPGHLIKKSPILLNAKSSFLS